MTRVAKTGVAVVSPNKAAKSWRRYWARVGVALVICSSTKCPAATAQITKVAGAPTLVSTMYRSSFLGTFTGMDLVLVDTETQTGRPEGDPFAFH